MKKIRIYNTEFKEILNQSTYSYIMVILFMERGKIVQRYCNELNVVPKQK